MGLLSEIGLYIGGLVFFIAVSSFIPLYAISVSGIASPQYMNKFVNAIANSTYPSQLPSNVSTGNVSRIESEIGINSSCGIACLLGEISLGKSGGSLSSLLSEKAMSMYLLLFEALSVIGAALIVISSKGTSRLSNLGKTTLSVSVFNFAGFFAIFSMILPYISRITINGTAVKMPVNLLSPLIYEIYILDAVFGGMGIALILTAFVIKKEYADKGK